MEKRVILIMVLNRSRSAVEVQKLLTEYGCVIKTRLGIHDGVGESCSEAGLLMLEVAGDNAKQNELVAKLSGLSDISVKNVVLSI